jgi:hypothetical protein
MDIQLTWNEIFLADFQAVTKKLKNILASDLDF